MRNHLWVLFSLSLQLILGLNFGQFRKFEGLSIRGNMRPLIGARAFRILSWAAEQYLFDSCESRRNVRESTYTGVIIQVTWPSFRVQTLFLINRQINT